MCGIVGYIGDNAVQNVISGLKSLEYRGYDSAGVAMMKDGYAPVTIKSQGRIDALENKLNGHEASLAIGHTRWATHGKPSETNAHPHVSGDIAIVHNGIVENYHGLKQEKEFKDRRLISETDTEIIAHIIDMGFGDLYRKVRYATSHIVGSYALAVVSKNEPDAIVIAREKSPLVAGLFEGGAVVASDIHAVLPHTNKVIVLHDGDVAIVRKNSIDIFGADGKSIEREPLEIPWSVAQASKGNFQTFMDKEIHEQPVAIYDTMIKNDWTAVAQKIFDIFDEKAISGVTLTACGTSLHACMVGAMMIEGMARVRAQARLASEMEASGAIVKNDLVIAISQSGETADTLQAIRYAKKENATVIAIVNTLGSSIEREADYTVRMAAGPEVSVASTKAFVAQLAVLGTLAVAIRGISWSSFHASKMFEDAQCQIYQCAEDMEKIFDQQDSIKAIAKGISSAKSVLFLGRGLFVPIAFEGALKLKEISYIHAEGFAAGEMKHGPIALIEEDTPVIAIAIKGHAYRKSISNIEEARSRGAKIIAVALEGDNDIVSLADEVIYVPDVGELFIPIMVTVPLQLLAMYAAEAVGTDIDKPRNLAKSVTVE